MMRMSNYTIAICDDEVQIAKLIQKKIMNYSIQTNIDFQILLYHDGRTLLNEMSDEVDILFLDIEMPGLNGIETALELRKKNKDIQIIFLTAFREYVFESFKARAFRYLLKPLKDEELREALDDFFSLEDSGDYLSYTFGSEQFSIRYEDILYIEGMRGKIFIYTAKRIFRWRGALSVLYTDRHMNEYGLFLVHQSYVINMKKITQYNSREIILEGSHTVPISKQRLNEFKAEYIRQLGF